MREEHKPLLEQLFEYQRGERALRTQSLGPVAAAAGMVRESCATTRALLDDLESSVGFHLEILDALLRCRYGNRWWETLQDPPSEGES